MIMHKKLLIQKLLILHTSKNCNEMKIDKLGLKFGSDRQV